MDVVLRNQTEFAGGRVRTVRQEDAVEVLVDGGAGDAGTPVRDEPDGVDSLPRVFDEDDALVALRALDQRLADLPHAEVDDADEGNEADAAFEAAEEASPETARGEVAEDGDEGGDDDGGDQLGDEFAVGRIAHQVGRPDDGTERPRQADERELEDEHRHRERCDEEESGHETRLQAPSEAHTPRVCGGEKNVRPPGSVSAFPSPSLHDVCSPASSREPAR